MTIQETSNDGTGMKTGGESKVQKKKGKRGEERKKPQEPTPRETKKEKEGKK